MARIVSLGSALQDIYLIDRDDFAGAKVAGNSIFGELVVGSKVNIDRVSYNVGGGGTNSAVSFARYGHETIYMGCIAHDAAGEAVLACLDDENIDSSYVEFVRGETGCSVILLDAKKGERTILTHRGAAGKFERLSADDLEMVNPDWLYASTLHGDMAKLQEFFEKAHALGAKVMFNPGDGEIAQLSKLISLFAHVDILLVNKREAAKIVPGVGLSELLTRLANYCETVIITDGSMGSIATDHHEVWRLGVYEHVRMRDSTGAGDAFGAGFLAKYADSLAPEAAATGAPPATSKFADAPEAAATKSAAPGRDNAEPTASKFADALQFGAANAASVVQKYGAKTGILDNDAKLHPMVMQKIEDIVL